MLNLARTNNLLNEALPALLELKQSGKARFVGITGYWPGFLARLAVSHKVDCVLNYCHSNLFADDMAVDLVPLAKKQKLGIINASPLHMGLLGTTAVPEWHPAPAVVRQAAEHVKVLCKQHAVNPAQYALHHCLVDQSSSSVLIGISCEADLVTAVEAIDLAVPEELDDAVSNTVKPVFNAFWPSGRAENSLLQASGTQTSQRRVTDESSFDFRYRIRQRCRDSRSADNKSEFPS